MDVRPGVGLGPFLLGLPVNDAVAYIHAAYHTYSDVDFIYDRACRPGCDMMLQAAELGIVLRFDPTSQRLKRIDFFPTKKLELTYRSKTFASRKQSGRFQEIHRLFGPCRGVFDKKSKVYSLQYPGVTFGFKVSAEHQRLYINGEMDLTVDGKFADGTDPVISCGSVFVGIDPAKAKPPPVGAPACSSFYGERVMVRQGLGLIFETRKKEMRFGDSCQQIISEFGPPEGIFQKGDVTRVHARLMPEEPRTGIFFNYKSLGVDVLFSPDDYRALKFVIHANVPGHFDFNIYSKCNFFCDIISKSTSTVPNSTPLASSVIDRQPSTTTTTTMTMPQHPIINSNGNNNSIGKNNGNNNNGGNGNINSNGNSSNNSNGNNNSNISNINNKNAEAANLIQMQNLTYIHDDISSSPSSSFSSIDLDTDMTPVAATPKPTKSKKKKSKSKQPPTIVQQPSTSQHPSSSSSTSTSTLTPPSSTLPSSSLVSSSSGADVGVGGGVRGRQQAHESETYQRPSSFSITPETKWDQVIRALGSTALSEPVVLQQSPITNNSNPFGATHLWNYGSYIFEVMSSNRISTVTLFQSNEQDRPTLLEPNF